MKNLNILILFFVLILVTGYVFNKTDYIQYQENNQTVMFTGDDYINIQQLDNHTFMIYCPGDTIFINVNEYQNEEWEISVALDKLKCKL